MQPPPGGAVGLRVSKRLLWVGDAYYPLRNIARVHTLTLHPRRKDAVLLFLKRILFIGWATAGLFLLGSVIDMSNDSDGGSSNSWLTILTLVSVVAAAYALVAMLGVLSAPSVFVLAVDTAGLSTAVVTSQHPQQLQELAQQIADAIENPQTEFEVRVNTLTVSPHNYYFGDNVNMYGGAGNIGMAS